MNKIPYSFNEKYVLRTPAQNLGKVKIDQTVNIKLQNYPDYEFGVLKGKVNHSSEISNKDGFYTIDVSLPDKLITSYNKEIVSKQEMRGTAEIVTEDLRLMQRFFYQFNKILKR
ncbi:MAG: HlyD family secretion protein [Polaribacter sp.]